MKNFFVILAMILVMNILSAQQLNLQQALDLAISNNPTLAAQSSALEAARWGKYNAFSNFLPKLDFNSQIVRIDSDRYDAANQIFQIPVLDGTSQSPTGDYIPLPGSMMGNVYKTSFQSNLVVTQPIFNGGKIWLGYQLSNLNQQLLELEFQNAKNELREQVAVAHFAVLKLAEYQQVQALNITALEAHLQTTEDKYEAGMVLENEVLRWQLELSQAKLELQDLENQAEIALENWFNLTGAAVDMQPRAIDIAAESNWQELISQEQQKFVKSFIQQVKQTNPLLKMLAISEKLAAKQHDFSKSEFLPSLNLQYNYQLENDDKFDLQGDENWSLAALISVPLWSSGSNYTNYRSSKAEYLKNSRQLQQQKKDLLLAAKSSSMQHYSLAQKVKKNQQNQEMIQRNYNLISDLYDQGMISGAELKDAETMLRAGRMELIGAYYDFIISQYEIKKWSNK